MIMIHASLFSTLHPLCFQGKFVQENVSAGILVGNHTLVLQKVGRNHAGLFTCVASNSEGDGESNPFTLDIRCKN